MKKLLLLFGVAVLCTGCPMAEFTDVFWGWAVLNKTEQTLKLNISTSDGEVIRELFLPTDELARGGIEWLWTKNTGERRTLHFDHYFQDMTAKYGEDISWQIVSEDGDVVLKEWKYSDRNLPGQRFFDEQEWIFDKGRGSGGMLCTWAFELSQEDIVAQ